MTTHFALGPPEHGVTRHGAALAGQDRVELRHVGGDASSLESLLRQVKTPIHVHLTDHLLGDNAEGVERGSTCWRTRHWTCISRCTTSPSPTKGTRATWSTGGS